MKKPNANGESGICSQTLKFRDVILGRERVPVDRNRGRVRKVAFERATRETPAIRRHQRVLDPVHMQLVLQHNCSPLVRTVEVLKERVVDRVALKRSRAAQRVEGGLGALAAHTLGELARGVFLDRRVAEEVRVGALKHAQRQSLWSFYGGAGAIRVA